MLWDFEKETIYRSDVILRFTEAFNDESIMSGRSSSVIVTAGGSVRQNTLPNSVKFAGEESKDKMYEPKHTKKLIRVLTVVAYVFSVSLAAIMLSVYYVFLWNPKDIPHRSVHLTTPTPGTTCAQPMAVLSKQGDIEALPQKQDVETNTMKMEYSKKTTPIPLVSLLAQSQPRQEPSTTSNQQTSTNITPRKLLGT